MHTPVTLITGTRKGIGHALADHYVKQGHSVIGCSRGEVSDLPSGYTHFALDVSDEQAVTQMFREIRTKYKGLDHLINNAGIGVMNHALLTPLSTFEKLYNTNVIGSFLFCREAAKIMQSGSFGRIINFSTVAVPLKLAGEAAYIATKAAIDALTDVLAKEFAAMGITVNSLGPTPIRTDLIRSVPEDKIRNIIEMQAIQRYGEFGDIINVTDFYLRPESSFVTGQHIYLGGVS